MARTPGRGRPTLGPPSSAIGPTVHSRGARSEVSHAQRRASRPALRPGPLRTRRPIPARSRRRARPTPGSPPIAAPSANAGPGRGAGVDRRRRERRAPPRCSERTPWRGPAHRDPQRRPRRAQRTPTPPTRRQPCDPTATRALRLHAPKRSGSVLQSFARQWRPDEQGQRDAAGLGSAPAAWASRSRSRLLAAGNDVAVWNRTRAKAEPLADLGRHHRRRSRRPLRPRHRLHDGGRRRRLPAGRARRDRPAVARRPPRPASSSTRPRSRPARRRSSATRPSHARHRGPRRARVRGNPKVVAAGRLTIVALRPARGLRPRRALPRPSSAPGVTYVGEGDRARLVKICHNLHARHRRPDARRDRRASPRRAASAAPTSWRSSTTASWARCSRATRRRPT